MSESNQTAIDAEFITDYLHRHIPITEAMGVRAVRTSDHDVLLSALFSPNINHRGTVFGGSAGTLAILACWSMLFRKLRLQNFDGRIVIQHSSFNFLKPIQSDFKALCVAPEPGQWNKFMNTLERWNKARIRMKAEVICDDEVAGKFEGEYVALAN